VAVTPPMILQKSRSDKDYLKWKKTAKGNDVIRIAKHFFEAGQNKLYEQSGYLVDSYVF
jgi:hypothetical protein